MPDFLDRLRLDSRDGSRSFYQDLRTRDNEPDLEDGRLQIAGADDANRRLHSTSGASGQSKGLLHKDYRTKSGQYSESDDGDDDVPASLLMENNADEISEPLPQATTRKFTPPRSGKKAKMGLEDATRQQPLYEDSIPTGRNIARPVPMGSLNSANRKEKALWRWVNTSNLDRFMRDVYDYYEGGGMWCIMCSNALWLLETLFVAILLTFLTQCVDYSKVPKSKSLQQVVIKQCTRKMSGIWNFGIWLYSFFFIWKTVQYFFEIRRLSYIREFYLHLLEIPEQDMQTVSWQDIVARIMALRDQNPKTATNIPSRLRRFIGSQSKERLDAHDIANRLMRKENYLIAMINKDVLNLSLPVPFLRGRQLFSKTMEWYLHYGILDMAFNELGQVQQDFLRADRRGILSQKLKQRLMFAGILNLIFAPVVLAYVVIVYFFTYYNEYQKDPKLAAARKYTALAEWKFREFNELPHIFYERLHMSYPFATRYVDQFPKRMTEEIARSVAFMSGAITAVLAVCTVLDSELFLGFEITQDRTVLFYLGVFGAIWAMTRGMVSEETLVFNPEYALRNVIEYTHYQPDHWETRLHSFEVKQEFSELYKMKVVIFLEEVMGIITTPLLLLFALPKCSDQIVDFFREFTIHVDGLGYVCSFAVFDFRKGLTTQGKPGALDDVRQDYYSTKHGKMAASYYGFLDNYVVNPKTGIPGHLPPGGRQPFHHPPAFPSMNSPTFAADVQGSSMVQDSRMANAKATQRQGMVQPSPMASMLLDPRHQPSHPQARSLHKSRAARGMGRGSHRIIEETSSEGRLGTQQGSRSHMDNDDDLEDDTGELGESVWETSPAKGLSRENSAANTEEPEGGVLGLIYQLQQTQAGRRGSSVV